LGVDEFLVILQNIESSEDAQKVAPKFFALIQKPMDIKGIYLFVTASIRNSIYPIDATKIHS
jgi:GGDEF domain-containing protein